MGAFGLLEICAVINPNIFSADTINASQNEDAGFYPVIVAFAMIAGGIIARLISRRKAKVI